jgi:hypothetical protein
MIYYSIPHVNGNISGIDVVDKWRIEWDTSADFDKKLTSVTTRQQFKIVNLVMGKTYYIRVVAHHTGGYGEPSEAFPFKPRAQPDPPQAPVVSLSQNAGTNELFARSLNVSWSYPQIDSMNENGDGGDTVTAYLVEWSQESFDQLIPQIQEISYTCSNSPTGSFAVYLHTENHVSAADQHEDLHNHRNDFPIVGTFYSADIPVGATNKEVEIILENMPNIADVSVSKVVVNFTVTYRVTFNEVNTVPRLNLHYSNITCGMGLLSPSISIVHNSSMSLLGLKTYSWIVVPADRSKTINFAIAERLVPGKNYFFRVSAGNDLGFGARRITSPSSLAPPITQPTLPTQLEGDWAPPSLFVAGPTSLQVKIGPSKFDGGSILT